jgi:hypothetical protein
MRYIWEKGKGKRRMHIQRFSPSGDMLMEALCGINHHFNASINAPFALGRNICKRCEKLMSGFSDIRDLATNYIDKMTSKKP